MFKNASLFILCLLFMTSCNDGEKVKLKTETSHSQDNEAIVKRYFQYFNQHDWEKMVAMYSEKPSFKDPAFSTKAINMTHAEILTKYTELHKMIPDVHDEVQKTYISDDFIIVEFISTGTGPDGKKFSLPICTIFQIKEGKITQDYTYYDNF